MFNKDLYQDDFLGAMDGLVEGVQGSLFEISGDSVSGRYVFVYADGRESSFPFSASIDTDFGRECLEWGSQCPAYPPCVYCSAVADDGSLLGFWER